MHWQTCDYSDLLFSAFVLSLALLIDATEVGYDDRYGQRNDQHAAQRTDPADHLARDRLRYHVAVSVSHTCGWATHTLHNAEMSTFWSPKNLHDVVQQYSLLCTPPLISCVARWLSG